MLRREDSFQHSDDPQASIIEGLIPKLEEMIKK